MASQRLCGRRRPRRVGLVLGAGGVLGAAWMAGVLPAVQERLPVPLGEVDLVVGTSAGSVLAAALRCGITVDEMIAHQRGEAVGALSGAGLDEAGGGPWPPPPRLMVGSPRLALTSLLQPQRIHPWVGASAWMLRGRGSHGALREMVSAVHRHAHGYPAARAGSPPGWVTGGETWIVAVDYGSGRRVFFGRPGAPAAPLPDAVVASCSIPGWYAPTVIGGRRYVDGGVRSSTSAAALASAGLDEVFVLAPLASVEAGRSYLPHERLERRVRALITRSVLREVRSLRSAGSQVTLLTPGPADLAAMGANLMDPRRRRTVLETSLRTSWQAFANGQGAKPRVA